MRYREKNLACVLYYCDLCKKTYLDDIRKTGEIGKFWDDLEGNITLCDDCKKRDEKTK